MEADAEVSFITSYLLPNFNIDAALGLLLALLGVVVLVAGWSIAQVRAVGAVMLATGVVWWFAVSFIQDLAGSPKTITIMVAVLAVVAAAYILNKKR